MNDFGPLRVWKLSLFGHIWSNSPNCISKWANREMLARAQSMTWKGIRPIVENSEKVYAKGVRLSKRAMRAVEARLERHPELPKWDILIQPALTT
jgi:hypothetical protein